MKYLFVAVLTLLSFANAEAADKLYMLNWNRSGVSVEVIVNGFPLIDPSNQQYAPSPFVISPYVMPGKNIIHVRLIDATSGKGKNSFSMGVSYQDKGNYSGNNPKLASFSFPVSGQESALPFSGDLSFDAQMPTGSQLWDECETLTLDDKTREETYQLVSEVYDALEKKDAARYSDLFSYSVAEMARTTGSDPQRFLSMAKKGYAQIFANPRFKPVIPRKTDLVMTLISGSRVILIRRSEGRKAVETGVFGQEICIAKVKGKMTIVRQ
jgi:hypothetical protein